MKKTIISSFLVLAFAVLCYGLFSFGSSDVVSQPSATGTIKVCWASYCASSPELTVVNLVDAGGNTVGSCTIVPPQTCCKIQGDFRTGTYHFEYHRPTGTTQCKTADFHYVNGTDVKLDVICRCP
jgi:hypothetical protein